MCDFPYNFQSEFFLRTNLGEDPAWKKTPGYHSHISLPSDFNSWSRAGSNIKRWEPGHCPAGWAHPEFAVMAQEEKQRSPLERFGCWAPPDPLCCPGRLADPERSPHLAAAALCLLLAFPSPDHPGAPAGGGGLAPNPAPSTQNQPRNPPGQARPPGPSRNYYWDSPDLQKSEFLWINGLEFSFCFVFRGCCQEEESFQEFCFWVWMRSGRVKRRKTQIEPTTKFQAALENGL